MDIRTYDADSDVDAEQMTHFDAYAAENARLTHELDLRIRQIMDVSRNYGQLLAANKELRDNAAELGKALDMCIAERDAAYRELDAQTLKANSFRSELHRYIAHANELKEMLDISVIERDALRAELDAMREAHSVIQARMAAMGC